MVGSRPDEDVLTPRGDDVLPCLLALQRAVLSAQSVLEVQDESMRSIISMPKVQTADNPKASALALYLFDGEHGALCTLSRLTRERGLHILSYVFDGVYVLADSMEDLKRHFKVIAQECCDTTGLRIALKNASGAKLSVFTPVSGV